MIDVSATLNLSCMLECLPPSMKRFLVLQGNLFADQKSLFLVLFSLFLKDWVPPFSYLLISFCYLLRTEMYNCLMESIFSG
jgi:hypothetical protein